jgi:hypothetical protein
MRGLKFGFFFIVMFGLTSPKSVFAQFTFSTSTALALPACSLTLSKTTVSPGDSFTASMQTQNATSGKVQFNSKTYSAKVGTTGLASFNLKAGETAGSFTIYGYAYDSIGRTSSACTATIKVVLLSTSSFLSSTSLRLTPCGPHYDYIENLDESDCRESLKVGGMAWGKKIKGGYVCRSKHDFPPANACPSGSTLKVNYVDFYYCLSSSPISDSNCLEDFTKQLEWENQEDLKLKFNDGTTNGYLPVPAANGFECYSANVKYKSCLYGARQVDLFGSDICCAFLE